MSWALIAGGSKGLGLGIAEALANRHYDLMLTARHPEELEKAKEGLITRFNIQVEVLACDLSLPDSAGRLYEFCLNKNLPINILCNAAGLGGSKDFQELTLDELRAMIRTNIESPTVLSHLFIPLLKKSAPSYILNIGSMAGFAPIPVKSIYAATKSALHFSSYSLKQLVKADNISVSCACPGPVFTKDSIEKETIRQLGWIGKKMALYPAGAGEIIVRRMFKGDLIIVPGKLAAIFSCLLRILPNSFLARLLYNSRKPSE